MMPWLVIILSACLLIIGVRFYIARRETKRLAAKIEDMADRAPYGARLYLDENDKALGQVVNAVNRIINGYEEKLRRAENMEQNVRTSISAVSHDLRTPLTSLKGYLQLMQKTAAPEKRDEYMQVIEGNVRVLAHLIENFYDLSLLDMGDDTLETESVHLGRVVCERFLSFHGQFAEKGIDVTICGAEPENLVWANPSALDRVLNNLIQNLLRYAKSAVTVDIRAAGFTIINDAHAPLPSPPEKFFERFYTSDVSRSSKNAGLGLYITRRLLMAMGGGIHVSIEEDKVCMHIYFSKYDL